MKTKLTVTVDQDLLPRAKRYARRRGTSISSVIEEALRRAVREEDDFVEKWRGSFSLEPQSEARYRYLKEKYLADPD